MAPDLTRQEEERLREIAVGRWRDGLGPPDEAQFLASILLRVIQALEREDGYQQEQRERAG
jgi:hypothetical protein